MRGKSRGKLSFDSSDRPLEFTLCVETVQTIIMSSAVPDFLEQLRLRAVPNRLWGCQYGRQRVLVGEHDDVDSAQSAYNLRTLQTEEEFKVEIARHLRCGYSSVPMHVLSVFDTKESCITWAQARPLLGCEANQDLKVYEIDGTKLEGTVLLSADDVRRKWHINLSHETPHEYLLHKSVPNRAILKTEQVAYRQIDGMSIYKIKLQLYTDCRTFPVESNLFSGQECRHSTLGRKPGAPQPGTKWVDDLHDWYSTDEECEERNALDDWLNG